MIKGACVGACDEGRAVERVYLPEGWTGAELARVGGDLGRPVAHGAKHGETLHLQRDQLRALIQRYQTILYYKLLYATALYYTTAPAA